VVLVGLSSPEVKLMAQGQKILSLPTKELEKIWHGKALILYRDPEGAEYNEVFVERMRGEGVEKLQKQLYALEYLTSGVTGVFDEATRESLKNFQSDLGLTADGIASVETQLALFHLCYQETLPYLVQVEIPKKENTILSYEEE